MAIELTDIAANPVEVAKAARLRYVSNDRPGIRREPLDGGGFRYIGPDGKVIRDPEELDRIRALVIPPAWTEVWICPIANGHLQATGRDARGRKQYRYHARWREVRDETKYGRMIAFGEKLPAIRRRVEADLALPGLPRRKVLATVVRLLEVTAIRVGNEEYARENKSFGLTTLRNHHAKVEGSKLRLRFRGKAGKEQAVEVTDRRLARIVKRCQDIPGYELFQYVDEDGERHSIDSSDVNEYLQEISGEEFTAKDFRTWIGTVLATMKLKEIGQADTNTQTKKNIVEAIKAASDILGNTPAVCRKCYIHPVVISTYSEGVLCNTLVQYAAKTEGDDTGLSADERVVLAFLRRAAA